MGRRSAGLREVFEDGLQRAGRSARWRAVGVALAALSLALGCGGAQLDGNVYRGDDVAFRVGPIPDSWRAIDAGTDAELAFRDDQTQTTVAVNGRCGKDADDVPLQALTHHLFLHFTDRQVKDQREVPLDGRAALRTEILAKLDGVPKKFTVYVLKKDGCVYDFMLIADPPGSEVAERSFERFVGGFSTLS